MPAWAIYRVLPRHGLHRLTHIDRVTATPICGYEATGPDELVQVDGERLGRIPPGGVEKVHGCGATGHRRLQRRLAWTEVLPEETGLRTAAFWRRAEAGSRARGVASSGR